MKFPTFSISFPFFFVHIVSPLPVCFGFCQLPLLLVAVSFSRSKMSPSAMSTLRLLSSRSVRNFTTTVAKRGEFEVHPGYSKVKQTQQHYQIDNGLNVRSKLTSRDS